MTGKFGWSAITIVCGIFAEYIVYSFWPSFIQIWGIGLAEISPGGPGGYHDWLIAFCKWLPIPLLIVVIPGITIAAIVWQWRQP